ncbi:MFS transporter [Streptosporangium sp. NPDC006930]|uniref:MFS transporter n=1 Tax=unclassified Streptosporangium TaxID=2632669 RepID=UPI0034138D38
MTAPENMTEPASGGRPPKDPPGVDSPAGEPPGTPPEAVMSRAAGLTRLAAMSAFLIVGISYASFLIRVPSLKVEHDLSAGQLGLLLVVPSVSALVAMQLAGGLVARYGSAPIARVTGVALPLSLVGLALASDPIQLAVALVIFGLIDGLLDVSMNAHAIAVERAHKRSVMNRCHAAWSIGAMIASVLGGLAIQAGLTPMSHFLWLGVAVALFSLVTGMWMLPASADRHAPQEGEKKVRVKWRDGWTPRVLMFGAMGAVILILEGAVGNWSGVFLLEDRGATLAVASLGYTFFNLCQTAGRLVGDRLHERYGAPALVRVSGGIALCGLLMVVLSPGIVVAIAGFAVVGIGLSVLLPLIFSAVGHGGAEGLGAAAALARFTTLTYSGLLLGPVLVGWFAEFVGLAVTFAGLLVLLALVVLNARSTGTADRADRKEPAREA